MRQFHYEKNGAIAIEDGLIEVHDRYCGLGFAARLLNLSIGTVQKLVNSGALKAWETQGKQRRVSLQSIQEYQFANNLTPTPLSSNSVGSRILVVEDDENLRLMYQYYFNRWSLPIDVVMYASAMEAMIDMPTMRPVALLTDLNMPNMDGFKFIRTLRQHKLFSTLPIIVITGLSYAQIENRGGLPRDVQVIRKPADMDCLRHFLVEILASNKIIG